MLLSDTDWLIFRSFYPYFSSHAAGGVTCEVYWDYCRYMGYPMAAFILAALLVGQAASLGSECALPVSWHPRSPVYARITGPYTVWLKSCTYHY